jgi:transcriptional regulator with XRE-family HTH domain
MFWNNYYNLCQQHGSSPNAVAKILNISSGAVSEWKKGRVPQMATLKKVADYFGVSPDSLVSAPIGSVDLQLFGNSEQLPEKEKKLLALYNKIEDKEGLIRFIERLSALSAEQQKFVFDNLLQGQ